MAEGRSIRAASDGPVRHLVHDRRSPLPDGPWDVVVVGAGIYFRPEGPGVIFGTHHRELQADNYRPRGGEIAGMRVGLDQTMVSSLLELMPYFPILSSPGLNLGRSPDDIAGGAYYMNPEELPFEARCRARKAASSTPGAAAAPVSSSAQASRGS